MKKIIVLSILVLSYVMFGLNVKADTYEDFIVTGDGVAVEFGYDEILDRLYMFTSDYSYNYNSYFDLVSNQVLDVLEDFSVSPEDFDTMSFGLHSYSIEFSLDATSSTLLNAYDYNTLVLKAYDADDKSITRYVSIPAVEQMYVKFNYNIFLESDGGGGKQIQEAYLGDIEIEYFPLGSFTVIDTSELNYWNQLEMYLTIIDPPTEDNFINSIWVGFGSQSLGTGLQFTQNYFSKYVNLYLAPYAQSELDLQNMITDYVDNVRENGITVTMPTNYNVAIMVPAYWQAGIDYWYDLNRSVDEINITIPDLIIDMDVDSTGQFGYEFVGEIWGETLIYTVDDVPYEYSLVDEFNNVIPPVFGLFLDTNYYVISYNTSGGSEIGDQFIGQFGTIFTPTPPTRSNYQFLGWKRCPYTEVGCGDIDTEWNYEEYQQVSQEILASRLYVNLSEIVISRDTTFIAIWSPIWRSIQLVLNGGNRKPIDNFTSDTLIVENGDLITDNYFNVAFSNNMLERVGYTFEGWYIDEALTSEFNPATPITENVTLYAKWELRVAIEEAPSFLQTLIGNMGLADFFGYFLLYVVLLVIMVVLFAKWNVPIMLYFIGISGLSALFIMLGFFTFYVTIIIVLLLIASFLTFTKVRGGSDE